MWIVEFDINCYCLIVLWAGLGALFGLMVLIAGYWLLGCFDIAVCFGFDCGVTPTLTEMFCIAAYDLLIYVCGL